MAFSAPWRACGPTPSRRQPDVSKPPPPVVIWRNAFRSELGPAAGVRYLLLELSTWMDENGEKCFPSYDTLSKRMGVNVSTVRRQVKEAKAGGWVEVVKRRGGKGNHFRQYFPSFPPGWPSCTPQTEHESPTEARAPDAAPGGGSGHSAHPDDAGVGIMRAGVGTVPARVGIMRVGTGHDAHQEVQEEVQEETIERYAHARAGEVARTGDGPPRTEVPDGWEPRDGAIRDLRCLFDLMTGEDKRVARYLLDGDLRAPIGSPRELTLLSPEKLRRIQYRVARQRGELTDATT